MITIKNWEKYQSYKDRRPPWIRFHRSILDDYRFQTMSAEARALLPMLWLLACEYKDPKAGKIDQEIREIAFRLRQSIENIEYCLNELQASDFIECIPSVTKPLQKSNETVTPETETETETETTGDSGCAKSICPHQRIVDLYHELLPTLPKVEKLTAARKSQIKQRWTEDLPDIDHWRNYFNYVKKSDFLMGRVEPQNGRPVFRANLEWLTKAGNYAKVAEDKYHHG